MGLISRVSSRTYRANMASISTVHNCHCDVLESSVVAKFTNMRLRGAIKIAVEEDLVIKLPLASDCACHPVTPSHPHHEEPKKVRESQQAAVAPPVKEAQTKVQAAPVIAPKP